MLAVTTRPHDPDRPLVCLDETSKQLTAETRLPIPMKPGRPARCDYEYERNGVANLFMMFAPLEGGRHVKVTDRHTAVDYAHVLKDLADAHFAAAKVIVLVQDDLGIHSKASLSEAFPAAEARRLVQRFEWRYTPELTPYVDEYLRIHRAKLLARGNVEVTDRPWVDRWGQPMLEHSVGPRSKSGRATPSAAMFGRIWFRAIAATGLASVPKVLESHESVVIPWAAGRFGGWRCGRTRTVRNTSGIACDTRAT